MDDDVLELEIAADPRSSTRARRAVGAWLTSRAFPAAQLDDWLLIVSELLTNVVMHAHTPARVVVRWDGRRSKIEVFDGDHRALPVPKHDTAAIGGRGLYLVEQLSSTWGSEGLPSGKCVWATLETRT